jgi:hypothetical protein
LLVAASAGLPLRLRWISEALRFLCMSQAPELHEIGAGVTITPNGSRTLEQRSIVPSACAISSSLNSDLATAFMDRQFASTGSGDQCDWNHEYNALSAPV